jgi:hypothetical protein
LACVCVQVAGARLTDAAPWGGGTLGDALLAPTVLYVRPVLQLIQQLPVKVRLLGTLLEGCSLLTTDKEAVLLQWVCSLTWAACYRRRALMCAVPEGNVHHAGPGAHDRRRLPGKHPPRGALQTRIDRSAWDVPELFQWLQKVRHVDVPSSCLCNADQTGQQIGLHRGEIVMTS